MHASRVTALQRQEAALTFVKRERWTEDDVAALPLGEHDYFDRKAGALFDSADKNNLLDVLAKEGSAFANSGGGHLVLGVTNDGNFDGVPRLISGRTSTRDWLEQKIPELLDYRLNDFRVHNIVRGELSNIPEGREVIVVDFADSALAPHQSRRQTAYFYRSAGRSIPAPHFYLELLRQRLTSAALEFELNTALVEHGWEHNGSLFLRIALQFAIKNVGRIAAYKWSLVPRTMEKIPEGRGDDYFFGDTPGAPSRNSSIRIDDTVLPGCVAHETIVFGVLLRPTSRTQEDLRAEVSAMLSLLRLTLQLATETSPGDQRTVDVGALIDPGSAIQRLTDWIQI
jgi:hypothetical protein